MSDNLRSLARLGRRITAGWSGLGLSGWFVAIAAAIVLNGMAIVGGLTSRRIETGIVNYEAANAALYTDSFIEPLVQELATGETISPQQRVALDQLLSADMTGKRIISFRIWKGDRIVHSNLAELVGQTFPNSLARNRAASGNVVAEITQLAGPDHAAERRVGLPVLEVYAPVRQTGTGKIIAIAETYEVAATLPSDLARARTDVWLLVAAIGFAMVALQYVTVRNGSRTIDRQRAALDDRVAELSRLLTENALLRQREGQANRRVADLNERTLRRLGADLHDGPVQLIGMSMLRLDSLGAVLADAPPALQQEAEDDMAVIREALGDSLDEIRNMSAGLAPPEIEQLPLTGAMQMAARRHARRTGSHVVCDLAGLPEQVPFPLKVCLYRFAQEGLNNAFRHADGAGQRVEAHCADDRIEVSVIDSGPGITAAAGFRESGGQGLAALRARIESLGGMFAIRSAAGAGTCLTATFRMSEFNDQIALGDARA